MATVTWTGPKVRWFRVGKRGPGVCATKSPPFSVRNGYTKSARFGKWWLYMIPRLK
jgi:hypothetical protein